MTRPLHPHERLGVYGPIGETLQMHKTACQVRRLQKIRPINELRTIFRAMIGDPAAQAHVTVGEVAMYEPAETFERFLQVNRLAVFEAVLR